MFIIYSGFSFSIYLECSKQARTVLALSQDNDYLHPPVLLSLGTSGCLLYHCSLSVRYTLISIPHQKSPAFKIIQITLQEMQTRHSRSKLVQGDHREFLKKYFHAVRNIPGVHLRSANFPNKPIKLFLVLDCFFFIDFVHKD